MPSKYGFKTKKEREAEEQRKEEEARRLRERERAEEQKREQMKLAAEERRKQQMLGVAMHHDAYVRDILDDYALANELPCRAEGPTIGSWKEYGWHWWEPAEKRIWFVCWWLYYKPKEGSSAYYRVAVNLIFGERLEPKHFDISGITGGGKRVKLSKRAVIEALVDTEPAIQYPEERVELGTAGY